ncbi:hypothetical protein RFI_02108 [Reticulomyxa filosa]|uniref:Uncharacterized protein n=1 Tax=Reticulomyxa filosa TaxID=46433 RepID=X6PBD5_RETFI|nr:hypothetical protein RFI_02108 [Reticulomyxa filosa]|eukprot:ETO34967.1 hypothetical protein RFI_02108 [Reticulomyxa filosa]
MWWEMTEFLQEGPDVALRAACANHVLGCLQSYLQKEANTLYTHVTLKNLRQDTHSSLLQNILNIYFNTWEIVKEKNYPLVLKCSSVMQSYKSLLFVSLFGLGFVFGPVYFLSRLLTILFPVIFVVYVYCFGLWSHISTLQIGTTCAYACLLHIAPGSKYVQINWELLCTIKERYKLVKSILTREQLLTELLGKDLSDAVNSYLPKLNNFDVKTGNEITREEEENDSTSS